MKIRIFLMMDYLEKSLGIFYCFKDGTESEFVYET